MGETHLNVYRCPAETCPWTLAVPTVPGVVPDAERYQKLVHEHLVGAHGVPEESVRP